MFASKKKDFIQTDKDHVFLTRHGIGKMMFSSGAVYEGQWQFDKMTGYGTMKLPDGTIQRGTRKEGSLQGCAVFTWPDGVTEYREFDGSGKGRFIVIIIIFFFFKAIS